MKTVEERFWSKVDKTSKNECWLWTACKHEDGYGLFKYEGKQCYAHRVSYKIEYGSITNGLCVCHSCDNTSCVNPEHLFLGSYKDNTRDAVRKGRLAKGEKQGSSKLTETDIKLIRKDTRPERVIAKDYDVGGTTIGLIRRKETWKHVK